MWKTNQLTNKLGVQYPIIQAPMAGGASSVELVASVSNAGGLGSLGAGYLSAPALRDAIKKIRQKTTQPFLVNLFIPGAHDENTVQMQAACDAINQCSAALNCHVEPMVGPYSPSFTDQVQVLLEEKIPLFSFSFGMLDETLIQKFKANQTILIGTATTLREAQRLEKSGIDAIVAQGSEAGGHRCNFLDKTENSLIPLSTLIAQFREHITLPIIAAGGIMRGQHIVELIHAGVSAVQMGTAFLCCDEAGIPTNYQQALLAQEKDNTELTKAFSGKFARGLCNQFIECMRNKMDDIVDYPIQNKLTGPMRKEAKRQGNIDYMSLWAGQSVALARKFDAKTLLAVLVDEANAKEKAMAN